MRGLVMDFSNDNAVNNISDEYMFGPSLLISPVYSYRQRQKEVYLPAGQGWYNLYSGTYHEGGKTVTTEAPYEKIPVFIKAGSIVPFGPALQYTTEKKADTITLYVYAGKDADFTLYEDEGTNYNYEKGVYATTAIHYSEPDKKLAIEKREGQFPGMLVTRYFRLKYVTKEKSLPLVFDNSGVLVKYSGTKQVVSLR
jgi:alpha-D-xyloside xylohydrolase